jgi:hypothetical protein
LVSIKTGLYCSPGDAEDLCSQLNNKADDFNLKGVLGIVCIFGQAPEFDDKAYLYDESMLEDLVEGKNVAMVLRLPRNDKFGLADIYHQMNAATEQTQVRSSQLFANSESTN